METMYTCPPDIGGNGADGDDRAALLLEERGASVLTLSYRYELETSSLDDVPEAMKRVEGVMLRSLAEAGGVLDCASASDEVADAPWRRLEGNHAGNSRRRQLRPTGGRGSNSIVGLSSEPSDEVAEGVLCRVDAMELAQARADVPLGGEATEAVEEGGQEFRAEGMAGSVMVGKSEDLSPETAAAVEFGNDFPAGGENDGVDVILASTRTDGGEVQIVRSVHLPGTNGRKSEMSNSRDDGSNDYASDVGLAFNYASTQSRTVERSSHTSHNPLVAPRPFQQQSQVKTRLPSPTRVIEPPKRTRNNGNKDDDAVSIKCTVVEGRMTVYSTGESYENLEGRMLDALAQDVGANGGSDGYYTDDVVLGVRMHDKSLIPDGIATSSGYMQAIKGGLQHDDNANGAGAAFTPQMGVLVALGCLLIALVGLFVYTSKPRDDGGPWKEGKADETYYEDDVEMDIRQVKDTFDDDDNYSADKFSVSSEDTPDTRSDCDHGVEATAFATTPTRRIFSKKSWPSSPASPRGKKRALAHRPLAEDVDREEEGAAAVSGPPTIQSSFFGLFMAKPRAEDSPDVQSVYDCDETTKGSSDGDGGVADMIASCHQPSFAAGAAKSNKSKFGGLFGTKPEGKRAMYVDDEVDMDEHFDDNSGVTDTMGVRSETPVVPSGCMGMALCPVDGGHGKAHKQANWKSKQRDARDSPVADFSQEVQQVDARRFFGKGRKSNDDGEVVLIGSQEQPKSRTGLVHKFGKMLSRSKTEDAAGDNEESPDICEVHEVFVTTDEDDGKSTKQDNPGLAMNSRSPSTLRAMESYRSPSSVRPRSRGQPSPARSKGDAAVVSPDNSIDNNAGAESRLQRSDVPDDQSVALYGGPFCAVDNDCWVPEWPDCFR